MDKDWSKDYPSSENLTEEALDENNSLRKIFELVENNLRVVDFGCATGYLAKLLKKKGCIVTGVEINSDAAQTAEQHCEEVIVADLDFISVLKILPAQEFDIAIFGDVLEHLRNPGKVLAETKQILKKDGYVIASIPNIAHAAIRLSLLQGRFDYTNLGILDNTHLRFFTRKTVKELFEKAGYLEEIVDCTKLDCFLKSDLIPQNNKDEFHVDTIKRIQEDTDADTLQFIIRAIPCTMEQQYSAIKKNYEKVLEESQRSQLQLQETQTELERSQLQLKETQTEFERSQFQLQQTQSEFERSQFQLQQTQSEFERSQFQLQQTQSEFERSQFQLQQTQMEVERSQSQLQQTQAEVERSQFQLQQTQMEVERSQSQLQQTQAEFERSQFQLQQTQAEFERSQITIAAMETSKFWKMRKLWFKIKGLFGLDKDNPSQNSKFFFKKLIVKVKSLSTILKTRGIGYAIAKVRKYGFLEIISSSPPQQQTKSGFLELPWQQLTKHKPQGSKHFKILLISHDATRTGAPICLLMLLKELVNQPDFDCWVLLDRGEEMEEEFAKYAPTLNLSKLATSNLYKDQILQDVLSSFRQFSHSSVAICNTAAISHINKACDENKIPVLAWLHELPTSIETYLEGKPSFEKIIKHSRKTIVVSEFVKSSLAKHYEVDQQLFSTVYAAPAKNFAHIDPENARQKIRQEFNLPNDALIILGCGTVDMRKGSDLFVQVGKRVLNAGKFPNIWFIWIGKSYDDIFRNWLLHDTKVMGMEKQIIFAGPRNDTSNYFAGADIFLLTSREDPFPLVNLEAMSCGLPVIAFEGGGGATEIYPNECGVSVEYLNVDAMVQEILALISDQERREKISLNAKNLIEQHLTWNRFSEQIVNIFKSDFNYCPSQQFKISVIVPNYNYSKYIEQRLQTILSQTLKPDEIIFLDDASQDDSLEKARKIAEKSHIYFKFIENTENSGSPFKQWIKGLEACSGDLIWIAEADDYCESTFLEKLVSTFFDPDIVLAYSQSAPVGQHNQLFAPNYLFYTNDISPEKWQTSYFNEGITEIQDILSLKNTIPNASAVVFRRPKSSSFTAKLASFRFTGDWFFYISLLKQGKIAFVSETLNFHRRHLETVTNKIESQEKGIQEILEVKAEIYETTKISLNRISESLGRTIYEYYDLAIRKGVSRPKFTSNENLQPNIERIQKSLHHQYSALPTGLNILVVIGDAEVGGGQIAGIRLANEFAKKNRVFLCNARPDLYSHDIIGLVDKNVVFLEGSLEPNSWSNCQEQPFNNPSQISEGELRLQVVRDLIRLHQIDVILSHVWWADRFVYKLNQELELPWFIRMHGCYEGLLANPSWDVEFKQLIRPLMQSATGICYSTERNIKCFENRNIALPKHLKQLFNGFSKDDLHISSSSIVHRQTGDFIFCLCSRAIPEKGWEEAIKSIIFINQLPPEKRDHKTAKLILIGYSDYAQDLQLSYQDITEIEFRKEVQYPTEIMAFCDVGLLPTRFISESLPSTIIEYLACSKPTIATDKGSIAEMISLHGKDAGIIVPLQPSGEVNQDKLIAAMLLYMNNEELLNLHKLNTTYVFNNLFAADTVADTYLEFFKQTTKNTVNSYSLEK
ncbi:glycosyltransferase [Nodularia sphaerocarpa]|uniref:glycosyltransferase n=1 Tax=Nodularia sphaerocarpa TaxID=137816 RepID=UPI00232B52D6|nr:glycosyltransferase [Nodularia sphaerocarpa]MDB9376887.1 glycosyltransferase [Nodularia sphaerocarpa CS-585A2]